MFPHLDISLLQAFLSSDISLVYTFANPDIFLL